MTTSNVTSKAKALARDKQVLAALAAHFNSTATLSVAGTPYKVKELQQMLNDRMDVVAAADAVKAKWQTAVQAAKEKNAEVSTALVGLRAHILGQYGAKSQVAVDFGFSTNRKQATVETKAAAIVKQQATRAARGTGGKKQKAKITGDVPPANEAPANPAATTDTTPKG